MKLATLDQPVAELAEKLAPADLFALQEELSGAKQALAKRQATFDALMTRLFETRVREAYKAEKKDTGTVNLAASNTLGLKVEVDKTVKWDQAQLSAAFAGMSPEDARHYAKVTLEVAEAKFKAAPPAIQAKLSAARTVVPGRMKFSLKPAIQEAA